MSDSSFPILAVAGLAGAIAFSTGLGFTETYRFPDDGDAEFVTLERHGATLGLAADPDGSGEPAYWLYVDDVDAAIASLRDAGAEVVAEPVDQPWGERTASVRDPAGTLVHLGRREQPFDAWIREIAAAKWCGSHVSGVRRVGSRAPDAR